MRTVDASNMRQVYIALTLYAEDSEEMPKSLSKLVPSYAPKEILASPLDRRNTATYPADLYVHIPGVPGDQVPYKISFAYLRSHEPLFQKWINWADLKQRPDIGVLASNMDMTLENFQMTSPIMTDHGPFVNSGVLSRIRMDGSLHQLKRGKWGVAVGLPYESLFLVRTQSFHELFP